MKLCKGDIFLFLLVPLIIGEGLHTTHIQAQVSETLCSASNGYQVGEVGSYSCFCWEDYVKPRFNGFSEGYLYLILVDRINLMQEYMAELFGSETVIIKTRS
jgi:hypothetical protein